MRISRHLCTLALFAVTSAIVQGARPMNVLVIQTDEHNFRTLGCYRELMTEEQAFVQISRNHGMS